MTKSHPDDVQLIYYVLMLCHLPRHDKMQHFRGHSAVNVGLLWSDPKLMRSRWLYKCLGSSTNISQLWNRESCTFQAFVTPIYQPESSLICVCLLFISIEALCFASCSQFNTLRPRRTFWFGQSLLPDHTSVHV